MKINTLLKTWSNIFYKPNISQKYSSLFVIFLFLLVGTHSLCLAQDYTITVSAGGFDRHQTVVSFSFPASVEAGTYRMKSNSADPLYLQVDEHNRGTFLLDNLDAGTSRSYNIATAEPVSVTSSENRVTYSIDDNIITFKSAGRSVLSYYHGENDPPPALDERYKRGGYIHPVYAPGGAVLTNHLDTKMHAHHSGIWSAWTKTEFQGRTPDFWNFQDNTGRVAHADSLDVAWEGPIYGGLRAKNHFVDLSSSAPVIALNEEWDLSVYNTSKNADYLMFDLGLTQTANTAEPLVLPEYRYGGVAFRGNANWDNPDKVTFLTSQGYDRSNANATRARWAHMGGLVDGERVGIAVLSHPDNYRAPQPVRIHPETPYFVYAPVQLGKMSIEPGSPYVMHYRYITYDGEPDSEELNRLWNDYAYPPGVTVTSLGENE